MSTRLQTLNIVKMILLSQDQNLTGLNDPQNQEKLYQFVETRLNDGTFLFDDAEALVQYDRELYARPTVDQFGAPVDEGQRPQIHLDAVILVGDDGQLTDEDVLELLPQEAIESIITEIFEELFN